MTTHLAFDLAAYAAAAVMLWLVRRRIDDEAQPLPRELRLAYLMVASSGAIFGSVFLGSANLLLAGEPLTLGKSVLGGLLGGVVAVEGFKRQSGIQGSTGALLVPGIALGIAIGRIGCFEAGLDDYTHGIAGSVPWAVDFGDGVSRHPVQLYESFAMFAAFIVAVVAFARYRAQALAYGFYAFCFFYAVQRFAWEDLKPYPEIAGLTVFQWGCIALAVYATAMSISTKRSRYVDARI